MTQKPSILRKKKVWALLILGAVCLYPFQSTVLPSQSVLVVTEEWKPVQGCSVRQRWQNYSLESRGHEQDLRTDESGRATFPRRTIRASVLRRVMHPFWNILRQGIHASFGVHTETLEQGGGTARPESAKTEPRPGEIVLRRR